MGRGLPFDVGKSPEGDLVITFKTSLTYENSTEVWESLMRLPGDKHSAFLILNLENVARVDSAGVALLRALRRSTARKGIAIRFESIQPSIHSFLSYVETEHDKQDAPLHESVRFPARLGEFLLRTSAELQEFIRFFGAFLLTTAGYIRHPHRFRFGETFYYLQLSGVNAMSIVFMVSFLIGMVMAYQAAIQLKQFGANIFVADLVCLALAREMAPVFTAMLLAGRSGSAFAAEIGTMKVGEEIDALTVMGFNLSDFITAPKVFALMIAGPLLTMWSNASGVLGGVLVSAISLDITPYSFMYEAYTALTITDVLSGLIKAEVFAVLIGLVGCFRGFQTGKGADSVGRQTTAAVVSGIFLIIFTDAILTVFFHAIGW